MKKVISLLLVLVVVLGCVGLAACGGGDGGAVVDNGDSQPADGNGAGDGNGGGNGNGGEDSLGDILGRGTGIDSVSYTMEMTTPGAPMMTAQMWLESDKMRLEMEEQGQHIIYLANYVTGKAYTYMPDMNMAYEMDIGQISAPDYKEIQDIPGYNPTIVGTETIGGKVCLVVEYSYGGNSIKCWIWKEHGFPIRTETTTSEGTIVVVFKDIDFGDVPDNLFELPQGVQIMGT